VSTRRFGFLRLGGRKASLTDELAEAQRRLQAYVAKLNLTLDRLRQRDENLFHNIISALTKDENDLAKILATELSELRKVKVLVSQAKLGLESIALRLESVGEMQNAVSALQPAISILKKEAQTISEVVPSMQDGMDNVATTLHEILGEFSLNKDVSVQLPMPSEDTEHILREAANVVEEEIKKKLPQAPTEAWASWQIPAQLEEA
jgi:division protein CdvB (Snf7/Vps24/ESCRT-III family)